MSRKPVVRSGGGAHALADKLGWFGSVERAGMSQATVVPPQGKMVDVSVYALQDMLTILGAYAGPKDGNWSPAVMTSLEHWSGGRFRVTVVPKSDDPQTVSFPEDVYAALEAEAQQTLGRPSKPWYFWPLVITGTVAGIYMLVYMFSRAREGGGTSEMTVKRRRHREE